MKVVSRVLLAVSRSSCPTRSASGSHSSEVSVRRKVDVVIRPLRCWLVIRLHSVAFDGLPDGHRVAPAWPT